MSFGDGMRQGAKSISDCCCCCCNCHDNNVLVDFVRVWEAHTTLVNDYYFTWRGQNLHLSGDRESSCDSTFPPLDIKVQIEMGRNVLMRNPTGGLQAGLLPVQPHFPQTPTLYLETDTTTCINQRKENNFRTRRDFHVLPNLHACITQAKPEGCAPPPPLLHA